MQDKTHRHFYNLLLSMMLSLEDSYRNYRTAVDRYHVDADQNFELARNLLPGNAAPLTETGAATSSTTQSRKPRSRNLSQRETQMLQLIAAGKSTKEAAFALGITFKTAAGHRAQLMKKLNIHDIAGLVRFAIREGIIEP